MMRALAILASAIALSLPTRAQSPSLRLVKDIAPGIETYASSNPALLTRFGNNIYFVADDGRTEGGLWKTDGTAAGTQLQLDRLGRPVRGTPVVAGAQYLFCNTGSFGILRTDGSPTGTEVIAKSAHAVSELFTQGKRLFFKGSGSRGTGLWVSDGTETGTQFLQPFAGGPRAFMALPDGTVLFAAGSLDSYANDLWRTDGTQAGTRLVKADCLAHDWILPYGSNQLGNGVVFFGKDPMTGKEPWWSDGTSAGTAILSDLNPGAASSASLPGTILVGGRYAYFNAYDGTKFGLWRTDGTKGGTIALITGPQSFELAKQSAVFQNHTYVVAGGRLLESDGTPSGTKFLAAESTRLHGVFAGKILVELDRSGWQTHLFDLNTRTWSRLANPVEGTWQDVTSLGSRVVFSGQALRGDRELWSSDLTSTGTQIIADVNERDTLFDSQIEELFVHDGALFFAADDRIHGKELWTSDGTTLGTKLVADIDLGAASSHPHSFVSFGNLLVFFATTASDVDLWTSDGTTAGTRRWITLPRGAAPDHLTVFRERMFFAATTPNEGREIWVSDGTQAGTRLFADFGPGIQSAAPQDFTIHRGELYFTAVSPSTGRELFATDGSVAGTRLLLDIWPGRPSSDPSYLISHGSTLYFSANTNDYGFEPWATDGTSASTRMILDIVPGVYSSGPRAFVQTEDGLRFVAHDPKHGVELYQTDGTAAGTQRLTDSLPGLASQFFIASKLIALGRNIFFRGVDPNVGIEPFLYWGVSGETQVVGETDPGYQVRKPMTDGVLVGGSIYFAAHHPKAGFELLAWDSDVASVRELGHGCPNHELQLGATAPVLGSTMRVTGTGTGNKVGFVFLGSTRATTLEFGCPDHVGIHSAALLAAVPTPNFDLRLAVPGDPVFIGFQMKLQAWFVDLTQSRVESSHGLEVEVGR